MCGYSKLYEGGQVDAAGKKDVGDTSQSELSRYENGNIRVDRESESEEGWVDEGRGTCG